MPDINLATPLSQNANSRAMVQIVQEELARIDPALFFVYMFDIVDERLLDLLAEQFDMLGYNGWVLAQNATQKRELLKSAFELHAVKGTPGGIREVIKRLGFPDILIEEGAGAPEGAANPWAYFNVKYVVPEGRPIDATQINNLIGLIDKYKNARSVMSDFSFVTPQQDYVTMKGEVTLIVRDAATNAVISQTTTQNRLSLYMVQTMLDNTRFLSEDDMYVQSRYMINQIGFGTNGAYQPADFTITNPTIKPLDPNRELVSSPGTGTDNSSMMGGGSVLDRLYMRHYFSLGAGEGNGKTIRELVLIASDRKEVAPLPDKYLARVVREPIVKTSAIKIEGYWDVFAYININPE